MKTYYISETQNTNSKREAKKIEVPSISHAKYYATRTQYFNGSVLNIYDSVDSNGFGVGLVASKDTSYGGSNEWVDE